MIDIGGPGDPRRVGGNSAEVLEARQLVAVEGAVYAARGEDGLLIFDAFRERSDLPSFRRGDVNGDGSLNLTDAVFILNRLFLGGEEPDCVAAANVNGDLVLDLTDALHLLAHLFQGGEGPLPPFPDCGAVSLVVDEALGCRESQEPCR